MSAQCCAGQLACCCGSAGCSLCCGCCPKIRQSRSTRFMYAFYFILVSILCCIMMSQTVANAMKEHVTSLTHNPKMGCRTLVCLETGRPLKSNNEDPGQDEAGGEINQIKKIMEPYHQSTQPTALNPLFETLALKRPCLQTIREFGSLSISCPFFFHWYL